MRLFDGLFKKTLYFPGCSAKFLVKDVQIRHEKLLTKLGVKYVKLSELEVCCGKPTLDFGYTDDFQNLIKHNTEMFVNNGIKKIITTCPFCYTIFKKHYEDIEVEHITETILKNIRKIDKKVDGEAVTFYDSCNPEKYPDLYDNPRKILEAVGYNVMELELNKEKGLCCGAVLKPVSPKVSKFMAEAVLDVVKTQKLITMAPDCFIHFNENNTKKIKILELSEVLL